MDSKYLPVNSIKGVVDLSLGFAVVSKEDWYWNASLGFPFS